jgi:hypothetical protein
VNPNGVSSKFVYGTSLRFNPAAFTPAPNFTFGDAPKALGNVRELFNTSEDFNVTKAIPMFTERVHTDFRVEFFDVFNRHRFTGFDTSIACTPTSSQNCATSGEGEGTGLAYGPRNIQGSLRVTF